MDGETEDISSIICEYLSVPHDPTRTLYFSPCTYNLLIGSTHIANDETYSGCRTLKRDHGVAAHNGGNTNISNDGGGYS